MGRFLWVGGLKGKKVEGNYGDALPAGESGGLCFHGNSSARDSNSLLLMFDESIAAARNNVKAITAPMAKMVMSISIGVSSSLPRICSNSSHKLNVFDMQLCMIICREELSRVDCVIRINAASG